jgi:hypothetical protein
VALHELYTWTTTGLVACFPSFMTCLLARQEGSKRKTTKDDHHRRLWLTRNTPREQLVLTRETDLTFFEAVKNEHLQQNGYRTDLRPKRTRSMANWTGSLSHIGAMRSANPESGAYHKCDSVDSDIVTYVNRYEMNDDNKVKTITRKRKAMQTPSTLPITIPSFHTSPWRSPKFTKDVEVGVLSVPLPSVHVEKGKGVEANMGIEMATITVPTLSFVAEPPNDVVKPEAVRVYPTMDRI